MISIRTMLWSSVGKKIINALTGLMLVVFITVHLIGNLALLRSDSTPFNKYCHFLESTGILLYVVEIGLVAVFLFHIVMAIAVWFDKKRARPEPYIVNKDAGSPSKKTWSSKNMIITGLVLIVFTVIHVITFKYGPGVADGYMSNINGVEMRDLYRVVAETFHNIYYVIAYLTVIILLGLHLRHGFWSAFQSLGLQHPRLVPLIYSLGIIITIALAVGFLFLPIYIYFGGGAI